MNPQQWRKQITTAINSANEKANRSSSHLPLAEVEILLLNLKDTKVISSETKLLADEKLFKLEVCHVEAGEAANGDYQLTEKIIGESSDKILILTRIRFNDSSRSCSTSS